MSSFRRGLYGVVVRMHPADFRDEFGREMMLDFDDALHTYGLGQLWRDALWSLARQWSVRVLSGGAEQSSSARPSLLAGQYVMIREERLTVIELGRGLVVSATLLGFCVFGLGGGPKNVRGGGAPRGDIDLPAVYASSSASATGSNADPDSPLLAGGRPGSGSKASQGAGSAFASTAIASTMLSSGGSASAAALGGVAQAQLRPELLLFHPAGPQGSYEVATIKPVDPNAADRMVKLPPGGTVSPLSLRRYIMDAYGARYAAQIIGGPEWLNKDSYVIHGKVPEDVDAALQKRSLQDRIDQNRAMQQSLLAERFHLKAHFETRVLPVYELVPAKGGLKISEVPAPPEHKPGDPPLRVRAGDSPPPGTAMASFNSNGLRVLNARAIKMAALARMVGNDAGDRPIVDHTGFTGYFDIRDLTWAPLGDASAENAPDAPSLIGAMEKTLGIRLVPAKDPIEVLVIDQIERPSEN